MTTDDGRLPDGTGLSPSVEPASSLAGSAASIPSAELIGAVMGDMIELFRDRKELRGLLRQRYGVPCPRCHDEQPKREPTILLPGHRCRVHRPPYVDLRPELTQADYDSLSPSEPATPSGKDEA